MLKPYYQDEYATIYHGDCREILRALPDESVNCVVTSPPYFGLRDYGTAQWEGGSAECDHKQYLGGNGSASAKQVSSAGTQQYNYRDTCRKCGARRIDQQIGLEQTPEEYVAQMVAVFREVRRVLRSDGTLWLNLGDSYAGSNMTGGNNGINMDGGEGGFKMQRQFKRTQSLSGLKPKDLIGIPWRVAFALQADGWWLRQDIIWHKPNPMPEIVRDRCTKAHEYIFLMSKSAKYWYDAEAVMEQGAGREKFGNSRKISHDDRNDCARRDMTIVQSRNRRSVWTVSTKPYSEAHFATFPPDLIEPCVLAGCPEGGTVLDPFLGSGTTAQVANKLRRKVIGIELNIEYLTLVKKRTSNNQIKLIV